MTSARAVTNLESLDDPDLATGQFDVPDLSDVDEIVLLRYVDEYSDMLFNVAMLPVLQRDLRVWRSREPEDSRWCSPAQFDELENLVSVARKRGFYVVFLGA